MKIVDVIIPTMRKVHAFTCLERLRFIPWPIHVHIVTEGRTWAEAINIGLKRTSGENDVILMDDDVFINQNSFDDVEKYYDKADIFGFKLLYADGSIQHMGGIVRGGQIGHVGIGEEDNGKYPNPLYTCHATTSLVYIKRPTLNRIGIMSEDIPGIQMEDVDFSFRAIKAGLKILILPSPSIHLQSASKKFTPQFDEKLSLAFEEIKKRHLSDPEFVRLCETYPQKYVELTLA